jgi:hypothetical protein
MRIIFESPADARAGSAIVEQYGFTSTVEEKTLTTSCPPLLAAPEIVRRLGPERIARIDIGPLAGRGPANDPGWFARP